MPFLSDRNPINKWNLLSRSARGKKWNRRIVCPPRPLFQLSWSPRFASLVRVVLFLSWLRAPRAVLTELLLAVCLVPKAPTITDLSVDRIAGNCSAILPSALYQATSQNKKKTGPHMDEEVERLTWEPFVSLVWPSRRIESQSLLSPLYESLTARPSPRIRILSWTASPPITHTESRLRNLPYVSWNTTAIQERMIEGNVR